MICDNGATENIMNEGLIHAVNSSQLNILKFFVEEKHLDVNMKNGKHSLICYDSTRNNPNIVRDLYPKGAKIDKEFLHCSCLAVF